MTTVESPGGRKLNDDTSAPLEWHTANAIDPTMVRKSDSRHPLVDMFMTTIVSRGVVVGGGGGGGGSPPNGCSVHSFDVLVEVRLHACLPWPYKYVRVQVHTPVALPQRKEAPVPTEKEDGCAPVRGPDASRSGEFTDPAANRGSEQRQHIRQPRRHNSAYNICVVNLLYRQTSIPELEAFNFLSRNTGVTRVRNVLHPSHVHLKQNFKLIKN